MTETTPNKKSKMGTKSPATKLEESSEEVDGNEWLDGTKVPSSQEFQNYENGEFNGTRDLIIDEKNVETTPLMNPFANIQTKTKQKKKSSHKNQSSKKKGSNSGGISNPQIGYIDGLVGGDKEENNGRFDNEPQLEQTFNRGNGTLIKIEVLEKAPNSLVSSEKAKSFQPIKASQFSRMEQGKISNMNAAIFDPMIDQQC